MIERFPTDPQDQDTLTVNSLEFTYSLANNAWKPTDITEDADLNDYEIDMIGPTLSVWFPKGFRETHRLWDEIRRIRDQKIAEIEWRYNRYARHQRMSITQIDDIAALDSYVQSLADITIQEDPTNITWPTLGS
jgi:hypothetical protein